MWQLLMMEAFLGQPFIVFFFFTSDSILDLTLHITMPYASIISPNIHILLCSTPSTHVLAAHVLIVTNAKQNQVQQDRFTATIHAHTQEDQCCWVLLNIINNVSSAVKPCCSKKKKRKSKWVPIFSCLKKKKKALHKQQPLVNCSQFVKITASRSRL